jgi:uncharacterized membrane protein
MCRTLFSSSPLTIFRVWFAFGFPAFGAVLTIFWLMIAKPSLKVLGGA